MATHPIADGTVAPRQERPKKNTIGRTISKRMAQEARLMPRLVNNLLYFVHGGPSVRSAPLL